MTREEAEGKIFKLLQEVRKIAIEYYPEDAKLAIAVHPEWISVNNAYWNHKNVGVIDRSWWLNEKGGELTDEEFEREYPEI